MCQCYPWTLHELTCHQPSDENEKVDDDAANAVEECKTEITLEYISGLEKENVFKEKLIMSSFNEGSLIKRRQWQSSFLYWTAKLLTFVMFV